MRRLFYLSNTRLPTERAHGHAIMRMCEAFSQLGIEVELWHARRPRVDPSKAADLFSFYSVSPVFKVRTLRNLDIERFKRVLPGRAFVAAAFARGLLRGLMTALGALRRRPDVSWTRDPSVLFWTVMLGLPSIYEAHGVPERGRRWLLTRVARRRSLRGVVVLTSPTRDRMIEMGVPPEKIVVVPDAVDLERFADLPDRSEARATLSIPDDRYVLGYVGRFRGGSSSEKGIPQLIQAVASLDSVGGRKPLLLCVGGPMDAAVDYERIAADVGLAPDAMRLVDRVAPDEVPLWIVACDVVTIPWERKTYSELYTSPLKLFEYLAAGVPIVASDLVSLREVLEHEQNALLVEPGDPAALAAAFERLSEDDALARSLAKRARDDVGRYSWVQRAVRGLSTVWPELASEAQNR